MDIQKFNHEKFGEVRIVDKNGDAWFVAKDVCDVLGFSDTNAGTRHLDDDEKMSVKLTGISATNPVVTIINESGLYSLILRSRKPEVKAFKKWVTSEVLPSIRKHGAYATDLTIDKILNDPDFGIQLLQTLKEERKKRLEAEHTNKILTHHKKVYTTTEIAKEIGFKSAIALNNALSDENIQFKSNGTWVLYSKYSDMGYINIKQEVLDNGKVIYHRKWTQEGRKFLIEFFGGKDIKWEI
jgi:prophage antirepressor-like protein